MSLFNKSNKVRINNGSVETTVDLSDGSITETTVNVGPRLNSLGFQNIDESTNHTIADAVQKNVFALKNRKSAAATDDYTSDAEKEAERLERLGELSSSLENLIADFLPDADKELPTQIAKAVVDEIFNSGHVLPLMADAKGYREAQSTLLQNFQNMTMEEYAKIRPKLMRGITK